MAVTRKPIYDTFRFELAFPCFVVKLDIGLVWIFSSDEVCPVLGEHIGAAVGAAPVRRHIIDLAHSAAVSHKLS